MNNKWILVLLMGIMFISFGSAYLESFWNQSGNSLPISVTSLPSITSLNSTRIAFIDSGNDQLRTYDWNGTNWNKNGNSLTISGTITPSITSLNSTRIAFIDSSVLLPAVQDKPLRTYDWNGTDWNQNGNSLPISGINTPSITSLNSTRIAFIDSNIKQLRTYDWDGTNWNQSGNSLGISGTLYTSITSLNSTRIAFIDSSNKQLRTYDWDGTNWNQNGNSLTIETGYPSITSLNSTRIAFIDSNIKQLRTYDWDGTNWNQNGNSLTISGTSYPSITSLNSTRIAFIDNSNKQLRTYDWMEKSGTVVINYPTSLLNYGAINQTLQLNFTATDTNLDKVWYNYNGTNITITGATSGVANLSNITLSSKKNVTIYANDTAGNLNTTTFSWDYKVFENSRTINTPTVETTLETFSINVTANTSLTSVYLNWNGTEYSASGSSGVYTKTLTIPAVTIAETIPVYWRFDYSGTNISSSTTSQVVNKLIFQLCNATINQTLINFTTKSAENPFPLVNSSFKSNWQLAASEGAIPTTYNYEDLVIDGSSYAFCTNTNTTTFYVSAEVEYSGSGYATNFYYLNDAELIATSVQNINLYLLNDSKATTTVLRVEDTAQKPFEDYTVQIQSYDVGTGTFYTVGMANTDYKGEDVVYLNWYDTLYKFIVSDSEGNVVKTTGTTKITGTPTIIEITTDIEFVYDKFENFVYTLYYDNTTQNFVLTYTMPSGEVDSACLRVYKEDSLNQTLVCDTCETSSSATVFCNIAGYGNGRFTAVFYALGSHQLIDWISEYIGGRFQEQIYTALGNEDASFYAFLFAGIVTVALFVNAVFGIIALIIGLIGASALGFTAIQWGEMMGVIIVGGFIIWIIKR